MPWIAFLVLTVWRDRSDDLHLHAQPTLNEVFGSLRVRSEPTRDGAALWMFLFMPWRKLRLRAVVTEAIKQKKTGTIVQMLVVESAVMFFEVIFLYRELIDAITPWIAQQSGGSVQLGIGATLALASFGWLGVRGMSWFLFGRFGTPALLAILSRQAVPHEGGTRPIERAIEPGLWREPVNALKAETEWFHAEAKRMFELLSFRAPAARGRITSRLSRSNHARCSRCRSRRSRRFSPRRRWRIRARRSIRLREGSPLTIRVRG